MYANLFASPLPKTWVITHLPAQLVIVPLQAALGFRNFPRKRGFDRNPSLNLILQSLEKKLRYEAEGTWLQPPALRFKSQ